MGLQVIFPVRKGHSWNPTTPSLKLFAPGLTKELFDVDDVKLPVWPERMWVSLLCNQMYYCIVGDDNHCDNLD